MIDKNLKLGYEYSKEKTSFKMYSPISEKIELLINDKVYEMNKKDNLFELTINEDLENFTYLSRLYQNNEVIETLDPYANACIANGKKATIVNLEKTNPKNFVRMPKFNSLDAIIYELHVRDFTLKAENKGKYLGVIEEKQLKYLKDLGITHVQILPFYDYSSDSVDELNPDLRYNWGYDPENYNIPEGSYSTNPNDPYSRIKELKEMINVLHQNGIRVIMDVVYNHVYDAMAHSLYKFIGKDAFRFFEDEFSNGTGCGNDVASDNPIIRKYIVDSIKYWASEYNLDGFRFDLMGILDVQTMNEIRKELDKIDDSIIVLGEGWDLNTNLDDDKKATQNNAKELKNIAFFNDDLRDSLRGSIFETLGKGFVNSDKLENRLLKSIKGAKGLKTYINPNQLIQYVEAHDNNTVFDHFEITNFDNSLDERIKMQAIASSLVLTSQGIPFLHAGQEFFRTKKGVENSYKSNDDINEFDFDRAKKYENYVRYISDLIEYRKENELFKLDTYEKIEEKFEYIKYEPNLIAYSLDDKIFVIANSSNELKKVKLDGKFKLKFSNFEKQDEDIKINKDFEISPYNFIILERI